MPMPLSDPRKPSSTTPHCSAHPHTSACTHPTPSNSGHTSHVSAASASTPDSSYVHIESRDIPLSTFYPSKSTSALESHRYDGPEDDEELDPESTSALLRQHIRDSADADDEAEVKQDLGLYPFHRLAGLMSKAPLLLRSAPGFGTGSYGAVPVGSSTETSDEEDMGMRKKETQRKGSRLRNAMSFGTLGSSKPGNSRKRFSSARRRSSTDEDDVPLKSRLGKGGIPPPNSKQDPASSADFCEDPTNESPTTNEEDPPDNSPYAQVRASVSAIDNATLSINTPRMWVLSLLFAILGSSTNLFFSLRYPSVSITPVIALLLVHPLGLLWDRAFKRRDDPTEEFLDGFKVASQPATGYEQMGKWRRSRIWLGQGRWNEKEHSCVYISSNVSFGFAFATDVIVEQTHFYNQKVSITYQLLLILSTQILGYTFAGLTRRFLVRPGGMIWPGTLMSAAMFTTLHKEENTIANGWKISRWKFFFIVWAASFAFYFLPGLLMPALSYFSVITWFFPKNVVVANLFGVASGLGLFPLTFDWAQIAYIGSPLLTPFWAAMNVVGGLVIVMWILAPIAYYKNLFFSSYMPILSSAVFDNTGKVYEVSKILTDDFLFDSEAYHKYSRVYLPITYVLSYGLQFAALASLLTHTACWHGKDIWRQWSRSMKEVGGESKAAYQPLNGDGGRLRRSTSNMENIISQEDVHNRLMKRYKDAPMSWYLITFVSMTAVGMFVVEYYPVHLPWYGLLLALGICAILFIPIGIVMAITNQQSSIYLICQLVCGALFPGRPVANMVFVTYGYISSAQGIKFSADLKLGHYMKIPPRILFGVQMAATVVSSITQICVLNWMFNNVPKICTPDAVNGFVCPLARVHFNGSILWGVVGPKEFFGPNATYHALVWCFPIGAITPIILWLYARNRKGHIIRKINLPVLFGSLSWIPPATGLNFSVWALVCYLFNYVIKRRAGAWWAKYTMTLSAALDSGLAFGICTVFFGFVYPGFMDGFKWWGTEIYKRGCDWTACPYKVVPEGTHFGPDSW
ncbi:related to sexual differentiation process protein isp4 [Rhynchosporium secalis]|uniref:Related to sexual differentiation process protein isp4 n=1 Tax=Rhynchosporium secalis TaxID=38038 RepID=A0A1E1MST6_RHYSE|nr:related to sexual differentiation process protein isp4 [Rhynchosporium secalis]